MPDDSNLPPINADAVNPVPDKATPAPMDDQGASSSITFTPEQLQSLGLENCEPGETYTITIEAGDVGPDGDKEFTVTSTEPGSGEDQDSDLADISPTNDSAPPEDKSPLGISRKPKAPRAGLPDTKKLREV